MPQLDPTWFISQLFWLLVTFVALYFVLSRWALPRIEGVLAMRKETLASDLNTAQSLAEQSERARQDYERTLSEARMRAQQLFSDAMASHKAKAEAASKAMDEKVSSMLSEAEKKIRAKKEELIAALTPTSQELAGMIVEKLAKQKNGGDNVRSIVSEALKVRNG